MEEKSCLPLVFVEKYCSVRRTISDVNYALHMRVTVRAG